MDLRRLRAGEWMLAGAGAAAAAAPFLRWYEGVGVELTGWEALARVDALVFAAGVLALGVVALTAQQRTAAAPVAAQALFTLFAIAVTVAVWVRVLSVPGDLERQLGAWLAFAAAPLMVVAGTIAMRDERSSRADRTTDSTGVPVESPPEVERLPAPPP